MNSENGVSFKIGFDVAQTCGARAGCGWYADSLIRAMVASYPEHRFFLYHRFGHIQNPDTEEGTFIDLPCVSAPFMDTGVKESKAIWKAVATGKSELPGEPDIVQSNSFQAPPVGKAKLVTVIHDVSFWVHPEFTTEGNRLGCQQGVFDALKRADGFIFVSHSSHREFESVLPGWLEGRGVPHAVIHEAARLEPLLVPPSEGGGEYWLAVGSLEPRKNYENLLEAMELYWERSARRVPLHMAGGEGWRNERLLAKISSMENKGIVRRLGYVPDEKLSSVYQSARALLFPSWYEGFGLPVIEAMQCGCPVISSMRTSMAEIGGDAVMAIDPASPESIVRAMLRLESEPILRNSLVAAGHGQAARFSWEKAASATLGFYREVLNRGK